MNQEQIEEYLDEMLRKSERDIDKVFANRLKTLLDLLAEMHRKYSDGETISRSEIYKYNRFEKEMERIKEMLHTDYTEVYHEINKLMKAQYVENYLRSGYVYELSEALDMQYTIPSAETINQAILNPIAELTLPKLMTQHRNEIIRKIRIELSQAIIAGESYSTMAERLEKVVNFSRNKARTVAITESGRVQVQGRLASGEHAQKYTKLEKRWLATKDTSTRHAHRVLDGDKADKDGYFHYRGHKAKGPSLFGIASLDIRCRCDIMYWVNNKKPEVMRARDYTDADYQRRLAERIEEHMNDGMTEKQAEKRAKREVYPPNKVVEYQTYENWYKDLGREN